MTDRLAAIANRMETVRQLGAVVTAMRGIAAARQHEAMAGLAAVRAYAATVGGAIGALLALASPAAPGTAPKPGRRLLVLLTAEQGFAGNFTDRALDAARPWLDGAQAPPAMLLLAGNRGRMLAEARGLELDWSIAMPLHVREIVGIAARIADTLAQRLVAGPVTNVTLLYAVPGDGATPVFQPQQLLPFDYGRFPVAAPALPPLLTLPPATLLPMLAEEYIFAELCAALMLAFAAENAARLRAMMSVSQNVRTTADALASRFRQSRQEAITEEVVELAAGTR